MRLALLILACVPATASAAPMLPFLPGIAVVEPAAPPSVPRPCERGCPV